MKHTFSMYGKNINEKKTDLDKELEKIKLLHPNLLDEDISVADEIGEELFKKGYYPSVTTSIAETIEYGFGEPDFNGFFPIPITKQKYKEIYEIIKQRRNKV